MIRAPDRLRWCMATLCCSGRTRPPPRSPFCTQHEAEVAEARRDFAIFGAQRILLPDRERFAREAARPDRVRFFLARRKRRPSSPSDTAATSLDSIPRQLAPNRQRFLEQVRGGGSRSPRSRRRMPRSLSVCAKALHLAARWPGLRREPRSGRVAPGRTRPAGGKRGRSHSRCPPAPPVARQTPCARAFRSSPAPSHPPCSPASRTGSADDQSNSVNSSLTFADLRASSCARSRSVARRSP